MRVRSPLRISPFMQHNKHPQTHWTAHLDGIVGRAREYMEAKPTGKSSNIYCKAPRFSPPSQSLAQDERLLWNRCGTSDRLL